MTNQTQFVRKGQGSDPRRWLIERDNEIHVLGQRIATARKGTGGVLLIESPAGMGKSCLLAAAKDMAREAHMQVISAQGRELEGDFPFGVAIQLFEPRWNSADPEERERIVGGPAHRAGELLTGGIAATASFPGDQGYALIHGLFWLAANLVMPPDADERGVPTVILVDDTHWADRPSLRFLAYLADRIADLPVLLIVAVRPGESSADQKALIAIRNTAGDSVLRPSSLSENGVAVLVRSRFVDSDTEFCSACGRLTGGNPFLLVELLEQVRADGLSPDSATAVRLAELAPESVLNAVIARLEAMPADVRAFATAVAVLGEGASLPHVAMLADLDIEVASRAADTLSVMHLLHAGTPSSFVHPLIASAVRASIRPLDRASAHRRAATILSAEGASEEQVAAHLLSAPPGSDQGAVHALRAGARKALATGAIDSAARMLKRALEENPGPDVYPELLAELGQAELAAGAPEGFERLEAAIAMTREPAPRAKLALALAQTLQEQGRFEEGAAALATVLEDLESDDRELVDELEAAYIAAASAVPRLAGEARTRGEQLLARIGEKPTPNQRVALAHTALHGALHGEDKASVLHLVNLAWVDGALLETETPDGLTWPLLAGALLFVDELEQDVSICDAALAAARDQESSVGFAAAGYSRAWPLLEQGRIAEAAADAQAGLDARPDSWRNHVRTAYGAITCCHILRGQLEQAETAVSILGHPEMSESIHLAFLLEVRSRLRLAQHRPADALADAMEAGRLSDNLFMGISPGAMPWRSTAALAYLALGETAEAKRRAAEELEHAKRLGVARIVIRSLRILGLAEGGDQGLELLSEAVQIGARCPPRLEFIHALIDLGAALRRANQRAVARGPLRKALELSHRGGATALWEQARTELAATGARPRRLMLTGIESLTPSELRVAEFAAVGLTTRQMAETLFVTPKTIEFHLRNIYQKLDVRSRDELTETLERELEREGS